LPKEDNLTTGIIKRILKEMKECGTLRVQFTGGEPMMREDLGDLITFAKNLGLFVGISTNGWQVAKRIKELTKLDVVFLSYDGPADIHSHLRGPSSVEEVHSAIYALKSAGIRIWTTTVLTRLNIEFIDEIVEFAQREGIVANFNRLEYFQEEISQLHPFIGKIKDLIPSDDEIRKAFKRLIKLKKAGKPVGSSLDYLRSVLEWNDYDKITDSSPSYLYDCWAGRAYGHIEANGLLYSCGWDVFRKRAGADLLNQSFSLAWSQISSSLGCKSCSHACGVENNLIFSLNKSAIFNAILQLGR